MLKSYVNDLERYNDFQLKKAVKILVWIFTNFPNSGIWFQLWLCWKVTLMISNVVWWMANVVLRHQSSWDWSRWRKNDVKTGPWNHLPQDPWGFQQVRLHHHGDPQQPPIDVTSLAKSIGTEKKIIYKKLACNETSSLEIFVHLQYAKTKGFSKFFAWAGCFSSSPSIQIFFVRLN